MIDLWLIGIGTGNPDHVTFEAVKAIKNADLILIPRKGPKKADLADIRHQIVAKVAPEVQQRIFEFDLPIRDASGFYLDGVKDWHDAIADVWTKAISANEAENKRVALLVWGDPSLYDSTLRIAERLNPTPTLNVVAGITSLQVLTAAHAIPINRIGLPFTVTTGRQLRENGWPQGADTVAVMLDGECSFQSLNQSDYAIWWGAYVGMPEQLLISGTLSEVSDTILSTRANARESHGWIMDIYILRKLDA
jgi:precorrin-6A synthase